MSQLDCSSDIEFPFTRHSSFVVIKNQVNQSSMKIAEIVKSVQLATEPPFRPLIPKNIFPIELTTLMKTCWDSTPKSRPPAHEVCRSLIRISKQKKGRSYVETVLRRMETYAADLEFQVAERTRLFLEEKCRSEDLLRSVLPG